MGKKRSVVPAVDSYPAIITLQDALRLSGEVQGVAKAAVRRYDKQGLAQFVAQDEPNKIMQQVALWDEEGNPLFTIRDITLEELNATDWIPIVDGESLTNGQAVA